MDGPRGHGQMKQVLLHREDRGKARIDLWQNLSVSIVHRILIVKFSKCLPACLSSSDRFFNNPFSNHCSARGCLTKALFRWIVIFGCSCSETTPPPPSIFSSFFISAALLLNSKLRLKIEFAKENLKSSWAQQKQYTPLKCHSRLEDY